MSFTNIYTHTYISIGINFMVLYTMVLKSEGTLIKVAEGYEKVEKGTKGRRRVRKGSVG